MLTAVYAARNIAGEQNDVWSVNTEMEYHEEARVKEGSSGSMGDRLTPSRVEPVAVPDTVPDELIEAVFAKLDPVALGAALGAVGAIILFLASAALIIKGGDVIGPNLSLLGHYLIGFNVTWAGAFLGAGEAGVGGFALGYLVAWLRNWLLAAYASLARRRAEARAQRDLLDKV